MISLHFTYCYYFVVENMSSGYYYMEPVLSGLYPYREITKLAFSFLSSPELFWSCTICWSVHLYITPLKCSTFLQNPLYAVDYCMYSIFLQIKWNLEMKKWMFIWENLLNDIFYTRSAMWYLGTEKHLCIT